MTAQYFLKIDGIVGESQEPKHKGEIEIEAWSWSQSQMGVQSAGGGGGAGRVAMKDLQVVMKVDKASTELFKACATGQHIRNVILTCNNGDDNVQAYLKISLTDVLVSYYQLDGVSEKDSTMHTDVGEQTTVPRNHNKTELLSRISLNFAKIEIEYNSKKQDGALAETMRAGYDLKRNSPI